MVWKIAAASLGLPRCASEWVKVYRSHSNVLPDCANDKGTKNDAGFSERKLECLSQASQSWLSQHGQAVAIETVDRGAAHAVRIDRAGLRPRRSAGRRCRPYQAAQGRAVGRTHHCAWSCA